MKRKDNIWLMALIFGGAICCMSYWALLGIPLWAIFAAQMPVIFILACRPIGESKALDKFRIAWAAITLGGLCRL